MRSTLLYLLLVGTPLLGLLAILTAGEQLVPPPSIGGSWVIQSANGSPCILPMSADGTAEMLVSQSGTRAEATFPALPDAHLSLVLSNDSISGSGSAQDADGCSGSDLALGGLLRMSDSATVISGSLSRLECQSCNPVVFTAVRPAKVGE